MGIKELKVRIRFVEDVLGTASQDKKLHETYIASKAPDAKSIEEEVEAVGVEAVVEAGMTVFPRVDGVPIFWDYQIKGFFKDAASSLHRVPESESASLKAYKKIIDGLIFVQPRAIPILMEGEMDECQRPLRAQTAQGERIAIAHSEAVPAGSSIEFSVKCLDKGLEKAVIEWLDYGALRGLGQWRNSGKGRFTYELI